MKAELEIIKYNVSDVVTTSPGGCSESCEENCGFECGGESL